MFSSRRRFGFVVVGLVVVAAVVLTGLWVTRRGPATPSAAGASATPAGGTMPEAQPPTQATVPPPDEVAVDEPAPAAGGTVGVALNFADWEESSGAAEISGFVSGVVENGGTCRFTLTRGQQSVVAESRGQADATTTVCPSVSVTGDQLTAGTWTAALSYDSGTSTGVSAPVGVEVPTR